MTILKHPLFSFGCVFYIGFCIEYGYELSVILEYLPKQLDDDELKIEITKIVTAIGANSIKDLGKVMAAAKSLHSMADGSRISKIAKEMLS